MAKTPKPKQKMPRGGPSARLFRAMTLAQDEGQNLLDDLNDHNGLSTDDLTSALESVMCARVVLDPTSNREEQHGDAVDLKDALEDAIAEASMLASEARAVEKRLEKVLAQVQRHDTFKPKKGA